MFSVEGINHMFFVDIDLISDFKCVFNEVNKLLHPISEEILDQDGEFIS